MKKLITTLTLGLTLLLGSVAAGFTPTAAQCAEAGSSFNSVTQNCGDSARQARFIPAVPGITYDTVAGDVVFYRGTYIYVQSAGTVTFFKN